MGIPLVSWSLLHFYLKTHEEVAAFSFLRNGTKSVVSILKTYKNKWTTGYTYKIHSKNESFRNINICNRAEWFKIWNNILKYLFSCLPLDVLSTLSSSLTVFVLEHPPRGNSGIFSLNSLPFRPFQHLQLVTDEWEALSCSCSLVVFFFLCSLTFCFSSPFPLSFLSLSVSFLSLSLCHIHKLVLSVSQVLPAEIHRRQQTFLFLRTTIIDRRSQASACCCFFSI